ncbi:MAG: hypothetical protein K9N47_24390 [Prosthecobacter sp.]|uniref:hypothetical protein n=1 Tax=Prosthecobacter sp. TaxID=1965333 RepID=UPI00260EFCF3|nr:hypothetical protein [Prosthecobacter sp.]MCF7789283.1 hypothetical protein [Prosthecobacter sp.]
MKIRTLNHPPGFISLGCLGYLIVIALLWGGCQGVYTAVKNRKPLEITVSDYIAQKPSAEWVTLKDAQLNLLEAAHKERLGKISEIFIPVRPKGDSTDAPVHILLSTKDDAIVAALEDLNKSTGTMKEALNAASRHADKLFMQKDVSGLIRFGIDSDDKTRRKLAKLDMKLASDFVILNDGAAPSLFGGVSMLGLGVVVGFFMLRKAAKSEPAASPPPPPNLPPRV